MRIVPLLPITWNVIVTPFLVFFSGIIYIIYHPCIQRDVLIIHLPCPGIKGFTRIFGIWPVSFL